MSRESSRAADEAVKAEPLVEAAELRVHAVTAVAHEQQPCGATSLLSVSWPGAAPSADY